MKTYRRYTYIAIVVWGISLLSTYTAQADASAYKPHGYAAFQQGNYAFLSTNYTAAIRYYLHARNTGFAPGELYFNLGNAYYRSGNLGKSIAAYLRAQALLPRHRDVQHNLATARENTIDNILPQISSDTLRSFLFFYYYFSPDELLWSAAILCALFFLMGTCSLFYFRRTLRPLLWLIGICAAAALTLGTLKSYRFATPTHGVIISPEAIVHAGPGSAYTQLFTLHDGAEVRVDEIHNEWVKIDVTATKGWLHTDTIELL